MVEHVQKFASRFQVTIVFIIIMLAFTLLAYRSQVNQNRIANSVYQQCKANNRAADGTNAVLDSLIAAVTITKSLPDAEKADRIKKYQAVMVPMLTCIHPLALKLQNGSR